MHPDLRDLILQDLIAQLIQNERISKRTAALDAEALSLRQMVDEEMARKRLRAAL